jgi:hypothetical protein
VVGWCPIANSPAPGKPPIGATRTYRGAARLVLGWDRARGPGCMQRNAEERRHALAVVAFAQGALHGMVFTVPRVWERKGVNDIGRLRRASPCDLLKWKLKFRLNFFAC